MRATFITLILEDGADPHLIETRVTRFAARGVRSRSAPGSRHAISEPSYDSRKSDASSDPEPRSAHYEDGMLADRKKETTMKKAACFDQITRRQRSGRKLDLLFVCFVALTALVGASAVGAAAAGAAHVAQR